MSEVYVGKILKGTEQRDAIHVAIAPVVAGVSLKPGQHVGFLNGLKSDVGPCRSPIGIVDPFLKSDVSQGQRLYLFLYPNTVTSLRHEWTHPEFVVATPADCSLAEKHLRQFAGDHGMDYDFLLGVLGRGGSVGDQEQYSGEIPDMVWDWYEAVSGHPVQSEYRGSYFRCAC